MDLEKLRRLKEGDRLRIDKHIYTVFKVTGEAVYVGSEKKFQEEEYVGVFEFWVKRDDDQKEFMLHVPQDEDREDLVVLHRVIHSHLGSIMNVPIRFKKLEFA